MGTRQTFNTTEVLRLEVEQTPTGLVNQIKNPPDLDRQNSTAGGSGWGWLSDALTAAPFSVEKPPTRSDLWVSWTLENGAPNNFVSEDWAHAAGEYAAARLVGAAEATGSIPTWVKLRFEWLDADGIKVGASAQTGTTQWPTVNGTGSGGVVQSISAQLAPAGTKRARLRFDVYGNSGASTNTLGGPVYLKEVTAAKAATAGELAGLGYIPAEPDWTDVIGPTHSITVHRSELNVGTLTAEILDAAVDPSQSDLVRPGKRVRLMALDNDTATWAPLFAGKIQRGATTYDATRTDAKRARVTLTATDAVTQLAQVNRTIQAQGSTTGPYSPLVFLWKPLEGAGVPYYLQTRVGPASFGVYTASSRPLLDQIGIVRDSVLGYVWVDRKGLLQIWDADDLPTSVAATLDESAYSDLTVDYDTERCINVVNVKLRRLDGGQEVEIAAGPYVDQASVDRWGAHATEFTVVGVTDPGAYAAPILAANATPAVRINSVDIPIRDAADIVAGKAFLDLYDLVTVENANAGISEDMRPTGLEHRIEDGKWMLHLDFTVEGSVAPPQQTAALPPTAAAVTSWSAMRGGSTATAGAGVWVGLLVPGLTLTGCPAGATVLLVASTSLSASVATALTYARLTATGATIAPTAAPYANQGAANVWNNLAVAGIATVTAADPVIQIEGQVNTGTFSVTGDTHLVAVRIA